MLHDTEHSALSLSKPGIETPVLPSSPDILFVSKLVVDEPELIVLIEDWKSFLSQQSADSGDGWLNGSMRPIISTHFEPPSSEVTRSTSSLVLFIFLDSANHERSLVDCHVPIDLQAKLWGQAKEGSLRV